MLGFKVYPKITLFRAGCTLKIWSLGFGALQSYGHCAGLEAFMFSTSGVYVLWQIVSLPPKASEKCDPLKSGNMNSLEKQGQLEDYGAIP